MADTDDFQVLTEQLLLPFGREWLPLHVRIFAPVGPAEQTLFCFHGFVGNGLDFAELGPALARRGVRVICPDMLGRGDSGRFSDPARYDLTAVVRGALAVFERMAEGRFDVLGMHWGGLIAALALQLLGRPARRLIACGLPLDFSVASDPIIRYGIALGTQSFARSEDAVAALAASPEFGGDPAPGPLGGRLRQRGDRIELAHDPAIAEVTLRFTGRSYDLRPLLRDAARQLLLIEANGSADTELPPAARRYRLDAPLALGRTSLSFLLVAGLLLTET